MDSQIIIEKHKKWVNGEADGEKADLSGVDLSGANLKGADLKGAVLRWADLSRADLSGADLRSADLRSADLEWANLKGADLSGADLSGADIDFSCFPLWCGSLGAIFDGRQIIQILYHLLSVVTHSNVNDNLKKSLLTPELCELANKFHRVYECGKINPIKDNDC